ncbi:hypothetical protein D3C78_1552890 [compost metagenome]
MTIVLLRQQQLDPDPQQQRRTRQLEERQGQQLHGEEQQDNSQQDGPRHAADYGPAPLRFGQVPAGQRDHDRVVAAEQDVDGDDLQHRQPEGAFKQDLRHCVVLVQ